MPTFEAITLTLILATVAERISEAILQLVNAHLAKARNSEQPNRLGGGLKRINGGLKKVGLDGSAAIDANKIKKGGYTKLIALTVNIVVGAFIVFVFDLNLVSLILAGVSQVSAAGIEPIGATSGQILSVFIIGLGADGAHQLMKRITPGKQGDAEAPRDETPGSA